MGEKIQHLLKSLILPTLEVFYCMLSSGESASPVSIATTNRRHEPVCRKTAMKGPQSALQLFSQHSGIVAQATETTAAVSTNAAAAPAAAAAPGRGGRTPVQLGTLWVHTMPEAVNSLGGSVLVGQKTVGKIS